MKLRTYRSLMILIILTFIFLGYGVHAWDNCPFGEENESYPGTCARYTDTDKDNICDLSQPAPENREVPNESTSDSIGSSTGTIADTPTKGPGINYYFIPIAILLLVLYLISLALSKRKIISSSQQKKIWNMLLLITFLISGIFGIVLTIQVSYGFKLTFYSDLLFWHVEAGIAMAMISMFHIVWHRKYFKKLISSKNERILT
ncbi:MAG: hypothetical protein V1769_01045 [Thermoplasmatota archaeon]